MNKVLDVALLGDVFATVERVVFGVMRGERCITTFAFVLPHLTVGVVNGVYIFCHTFNKD